MERNIKHFTLRALFRLFSGLADWTGGGRIFVIGKLMIGTLLLSSQLLEAQPKASKKHKQADLKNQKTSTSKESRCILLCSGAYARIQRRR